MKQRLLICTLLSLFGTRTVYADNTHDVQQRLTQQANQAAKLQDQRTMAQAQQVAQATAMPTNQYVSLPQAIYIFTQREDWEQVRLLLPRYEKTEHPDQNLIRYAKAKLAWADGHYQEAIAGFQKLVDDNPDFILGRLELAKALFLDKQNRASLAQFDTVKARINPSDPKQQGVYQTIEQFDQVLHQRDAWQGSLNLGYTWGSNLNQTSHSKTCDHIVISPQISFDTCRQTPAPVASGGIHYEFNSNRRFSLSGHHGVSVNVLAFGDYYPKQNTYSQHTVNLETDYSFQSVNLKLDIGPSIERVWAGGGIDHDAYGVKAYWQYDFSPKASVAINASYLYQHYHKADYQKFNGARLQLEAQAWYALSDTLTLSAGLSTIHQAAQDDVLSYQENGLNLGLYKALGNRFNLALQGNISRRQYAQFDGLLNQRRHDVRTRLSATLASTQWNVMGFYPRLRVEYERNKSHVNWLYSYQNTQVSLLFQKQF